MGGQDIGLGFQPITQDIGLGVTVVTQVPAHCRGFLMHIPRVASERPSQAQLARNYCYLARNFII